MANIPFLNNAYFSANVGIGTDSPSSYFSGADNLVVKQASGGGGISIVTDTSSEGSLYFADGTAGGEQYRGGVVYNHNLEKLFLISGGATKATITSGGNVGIGTDSPTATLDVNGQRGTATNLATTKTSAGFDLNSNTTGGSNSLTIGETNQTSYFLQHANSAGTTAYDIVLNPYGGNVGIGTDSPISILDLNEQYTASGLYEASELTLSANNGSLKWATGQVVGYVAAGSGNSVANFPGGLAFKTKNADGVQASTPTTKMVINSEGNVGIGTVSPDYKQHISTSGYIGQFIQSSYLNSSKYYSSTLIGYSDTNDQAGEFGYVYNSATPADSFSYINTYGQAQGSQFALTAGGNVGIGTDNPSYKLQINGTPPATSGALINIRNSGATATNTSFGGIFFNSSPGNDFSIGKSNINSATTLSFRNGNNGASLIDITPSGDVGIGTDNPRAKLDIRTLDPSTNFEVLDFRNQSDFGIFVTSSSISGKGNTLDFKSSDYNSGAGIQTRNLLSLQPTGNVGIGTDSPDSKLNLEGAKNTSIITLGSTTNNASWSVGDKYGAIDFYSADGSGAGAGVKASISYEVEAGATGSTNSMVFRSAGSSAGTNNTERMRIDSAGNVLMNGDLRVSGGEIILDGVGRIQGVDIVSASTDAASKAYVDAHGGGVGPFLPLAGGTLTGGLTGTTANFVGTIRSTLASDNSYYSSFSNNGSLVLDTAGVNSGMQFKILGSTKLTMLNSGNVGIGTTGPSTKLEIKQNADSYTGGLRIEKSNNDTSLFLFNNGSRNIISSSYGTTGSYMPLSLQTSDLDRLTILSGGNVGIGTASPSANLHIQENSNPISSVSGLKLSSNAGATNKYLPAIEWSYGANGSPSFAKIETIRASGTGGILTFSTSTTSSVMTERMRIDSAGNVGIGTNNPTDYGATANTLEVRGVSGNGAGVFRVSNGDNTVGGVFYSGSASSTLGTQTAHPLYLSTNNSTKMTILSGGNVGIGTDNPSAKLNISGTGTGGAIDWTNTTATTGRSYRWVSLNAGGFAIEDLTASGAERMRIDVSGNVGIGTTNPSAKLEVDIPTYSANNAIANFVNGFNPARVVYDTVVVAQQDVPCLSIIETPSGAQSSEQKLTLSAGDGRVVIGSSSTASNGIYINTNRATNTPGYNHTAGNNVARFLNNGNAIFTNKVGIGTDSPDAKLDIEAAINPTIRLTNSTNPLGGADVGTLEFFTKDTSSQASRVLSSIVCVNEANSPSVPDGQLAFKTSLGGANAQPATEKMRIDPIGNVGIGNISPDDKLEVSGSASGYPSIKISNPTQTSRYMRIGMIDSVNHCIEANGGAFLTFKTGNTEAMRIDNLGNVGLGETNPGAKLHIVSNTGTSSSTLLKIKSTTAFLNAPGHMIDFIRSNNTIRGFVGMNQYGVSYSTSSDYRLKRNIVSIADGIDRVKKLKPSRFNWDDGPDDYFVDGFVAHEVGEVIPEAITGEKDAVDKYNAPIYQGIDQSKIVPLLTAALQQAIDKIEQLELRINKLEKQ